MGGTNAGCDGPRQGIRLLQCAQAGFGRAARAANRCLQSSRRPTILLQQAGRADESLAGQMQRQFGRQPLGLAGLGQLLGQREEIGRAAAGNRRRRIDQPLAGDSGGLADGIEERRAGSDIGCRGGVGIERGHALADDNR